MQIRWTRRLLSDKGFMTRLLCQDRRKSVLLENGCLITKDTDLIGSEGCLATPSTPKSLLHPHATVSTIASLSMHLCVCVCVCFSLCPLSVFTLWILMSDCKEQIHITNFVFMRSEDGGESWLLKER